MTGKVKKAKVKEHTSGRSPSGLGEVCPKGCLLSSGVSMLSSNGPHDLKLHVCWQLKYMNDNYDEPREF